MNPDALPRVTDILHWRLAEPLRAGPPGFAQRARWLGELAGRQLTKVSRADDAPGAPVFLCTTILSMLVVQDTPHHQALMEGILSTSGIRAQTFLQGYQCAGWGFALRGGAKLIGDRPGTICIVDCDLHRSPLMHSHPSVGDMGFGVTTIRFDSFGNPQATVCDGPYHNSAFKELMHSLRADPDSALASITHIPFLPQDLSVLARRLLQPARVAPDLHHQYGHCFGSDAWIGVIRDLQEGSSSTRPAVRRVSTIANNGYFAHSKVQLARDLRWAIAEL